MAEEPRRARAGPSAARQSAPSLTARPGAVAAERDERDGDSPSWYNLAEVRAVVAERTRQGAPCTSLTQADFSALLDQ